MAEAADAETVLIVTGFGRILVRVDVETSPVTAAAFLTAVDRGDFHGGSFVRSVSPANDSSSPPISVVQAMAHHAAPIVDVDHEPTSRTGRPHLNGTISLPRGKTGDRASIGFFICVGDQPGLDDGKPRHADGRGFAAFGRVVKGMDVVRRIHASPTRTGTEVFARQFLVNPVAIISAARVAG